MIKPFAEKRDKALKAEDTKRIEAENAVRTTVEAYKAKRDALIAEVDVVTPLYDNFYTNASHRINEWNTYHSIYNKANFSEAAGLYQSPYEIASIFRIGVIQMVTILIVNGFTTQVMFTHMK